MRVHYFIFTPNGYTGFCLLMFRKLNHQEVVEEDRRNKEPKNMEARKRRAEYILKEEEQKAACLAEGKDWEIEKLRWGKCSQ
jgi:hypothetical protein